MTALLDIERTLRRIETSMCPHLAPHLFDHGTVADDQAALADILAAGLGPEPRPVLNDGCHWLGRFRLFLGW